MDFTTLATKLDGSVLTVTLHNGDVNVMSAVMAGELFGLVGHLAVTPDIKVVVFESDNPDFFIAHFDVNDILKSIAGDPSMPKSKYADINIVQSLNLSIQGLPQVTIAKVDGICRAAGFELALAMDMVFATENARFGFPEASLGFLPAGGGATLLPMKAGKNRALEVMLTGRDFGGAEAAQYGFVNCALATTEALNQYTADAAERIAANNSAAIAAVKATFKASTKAFTDSVMAGLAQENASMTACISDPAVFATLQGMAAKAGTREIELNLPDAIRELK